MGDVIDHVSVHCHHFLGHSRGSKLELILGRKEFYKIVQYLPAVKYPNIQSEITDNIMFVFQKGVAHKSEYTRLRLRMFG